MTAPYQFADYLVLRLCMLESQGRMLELSVMTFLTALFPRRLFLCRHELVQVRISMLLWFRESALQRALRVLERHDITPEEHVAASALAIHSSYGIRRHGDGKRMQQIRTACATDLEYAMQSPVFGKINLPTRALVYSALAKFEHYTGWFYARGEVRSGYHARAVSLLEQADECARRGNFKLPSHDFNLKKIIDVS